MLNGLIIAEMLGHFIWDDSLCQASFLTYPNYIPIISPSYLHFLFHDIRIYGWWERHEIPLAVDVTSINIHIYI